MLDEVTAALKTADVIIDMMRRRGHALVSNERHVEGTVFVLDFDNQHTAILLQRGDVNKDMIDMVLRHFDVRRLMVVYSGKLTPSAAQLLHLAEVWNDNELRCNPFQFNFVRDAVIVDPPPLHASHLPKLLTTDPLCRYLGAKVGDVVRVEISHQTKERVVVEKAS